MHQHGSAAGSSLAGRARQLIAARFSVLPATLAVASFAFVGCSVSIGGTSIQDPGKEVSSLFTKAFGQKPQSVSCPSDIPVKAGHVFHCKVTDSAGQSIDARVTETSVNGSTAHVEVLFSGPHAPGSASSSGGSGSSTTGGTGSSGSTSGSSGSSSGSTGSSSGSSGSSSGSSGSSSGSSGSSSGSSGSSSGSTGSSSSSSGSSGSSTSTSS